MPGETLSDGPLNERLTLIGDLAGSCADGVCDVPEDLDATAT